MISISPSGVEGVTNDGVRDRVSTVTRSPSTDSSINEAEIIRVIEGLELPKGSRVTAILSGVSEFVETQSYDMGPRAAMRAARLATLDIAEGSPADWLNEYRLISSNHGAGPSQVLHCALPKDRVCEIADTITASGMRLRAVVPERAAILAVLAEVAEQVTNPQPTVVIYLGQHGTGLAGVAGGRVLFTRTLGFGYRLLVEAIVRASSHHAQSGGASSAMSYAEARDLLFEHGIPTKQSVVDSKRGLTGEHLLPLLQPALQRYTLELRHTLRVGFERGSVDQVSLIGAGRGSKIAGLVPMIARGPNLRLDDTALGKLQNPVSESLPSFVLRSGPLVELLPPSEVARRANTLVHRALAGGVMLAAGLLGAEYATARISLDKTEDRFAALAPRIDEFETRQERAIAAESAAREAQQLLNAAETVLGRGPLWRASLEAVLAAMPDSVRLLDIRGDDNRNEPVIHLQGYAFVPEGSDDDTDALSVFLAQLGSSGVASEVTLRSRFRVVVDERPANEFRIAMSLRSLPMGGAAAFARSTEGNR